MCTRSNKILKTFLLLVSLYYCNAQSSSWSISVPLPDGTHRIIRIPFFSSDSNDETSSSSSLTCHYCFHTQTLHGSSRRIVKRCGGDDCVPLVNNTSSTDDQPTIPYDFSQCGMINNSYTIKNKALQLKVSTGVKNTLRPAEYPWLVRIESRSSIFSEKGTLCGGTLIHPQWVITAAHCVFDSDTGRPYPTHGISLHMGHYHRVSTSRNKYVAKPSLYMINPRFHMALGSSGIIHDLAMIKLAKPVPLSRSIGVACLPDRADKLNDGTLAFTAGWGHSSTGSTTVNEPRKARIKISSKACRQLSINRDLHICGRNDRGSNICSGDSGTGLMVRAGVRSSSNQIDWKWHVFGVASFGPVGCSQSANHDNAFASVSRDIDWIHEVMEKY